ncbi:MAG: hypothetical protein WAM85_21270 [Terracidiphilus sp.]
MAVTLAMRRLLHIRELQEEQSRLALESALGELSRLKSALRAAAGRESKGRRLVSTSAQNGELVDRLAGLEETRAAVRQSAAVSAAVESVEVEVAALRQSFLGRRVERRQAETLIQEAEAQDAIDAGRRGQQSLDDWRRSRAFPANQRAGQIRDSTRGFAETRTDSSEEEPLHTGTL